MRTIGHVLSALTVLLPSLAAAQPAVSSASGDATHGGAVSITGDSFGAKSPAAPLVWDDGTTARPLSDFYAEALPSDAQQGDEYDMQYRALPYRAVDAPHSRIMQALAGAHATDNSSAQYLSGNNVSLLVPMTSFHFFAQYWYRVDPAFDEANHPSNGENMKELCLSGSATEVYGGTWGYYNWCNNKVPDANYTGPVRMGRLGVDCPDLPYGCTDHATAVDHESPVNGWIKMQWEGDYDDAHDNPSVRLTTYPDGAVTATDYYGNDVTTFETLYGCGTPPAGEMRGLGIGGFSRVPRTNDGQNSFRYFTGIYVDDTRARVMLGDNASYAECTRMEPQIPGAWSETSISVEINLAGFSGGTAYLFVFDADNQHNDPGYPLELGSSQPPECADGVDNDDDGLTDYPDDPGCASADDTDERDCGPDGCGGGGVGGSQVVPGGGSSPGGAGATPDDDGCSCRVGARSRGAGAFGLAVLVVTLGWRRGARRSRRRGRRA